MNQVLRYPFGLGDVEAPAGLPDQVPIAVRAALPDLVNLDAVHAGSRPPTDHPGLPGNALQKGATEECIGSHAIQGGGPQVHRGEAKGRSAATPRSAALSMGAT